MRTEPIGSIPRPPALLEAMAAFQSGRIPHEALSAQYEAALQETIEKVHLAAHQAGGDLGFRAQPPSAISDYARAQIASEVGYKSEPAFKRAFKREFTVPPMRFRSQSRGRRV